MPKYDKPETITSPTPDMPLIKSEPKRRQRSGVASSHLCKRNSKRSLYLSAGREEGYKGGPIMRTDSDDLTKDWAELVHYHRSVGFVWEELFINDQWGTRNRSAVSRGAR